MKNLTIKKVALGLFLAGYAASGAFAIEATTQGVIHGTAPVLKAVGGTEAHTLTVRVTSDSNGATQIGQRAAKVGDYVFIKFDLDDTDGDLDNGKIKDTLKVFVKIKGSWKEIEKLTDSGASNNGTTGEIHFKIDRNFLGAEKIGFRLLERTDFGIPYTGSWLQVNDIWANGKPNSIATDEKTPDLKGPKDPNTPGKPDEINGPGDTDSNNGFGPITSDTVKVGIFKVDGGTLDKNVNYAADDIAPRYGEEFQAIVWNDDDGNDNIDVGEEEFTNYTFEWNLAGEYESVKAQDKVDGIASGKTITLENSNSATMYQHPSVIYKAGGQGYKLKVTAKAQ